MNKVPNLRLSKMAKAVLPLAVAWSPLGAASVRSVSQTRRLSYAGVTAQPQVLEENGVREKVSSNSPFAAFTYKRSESVDTVKATEIDVSGNEALQFLKDQGLLKSGIEKKAELSGDVYGRKVMAHTTGVAHCRTIGNNTYYTSTTTSIHSTTCVAPFSVWHAAGGGDTTPPTFDTTPTVTGVGFTGGTLSVNLNEDGKVYYVVVANGDSDPSVAQVKNGQNNSGSAALTSGNFTTSSTTGSQSFSGLSAGTAYKLYLVAQDDESTPNVQASVTLVSFTTTKNSDGDLTASATVTEPVAIPTTVDTVGEAINVFDFTLTDGGGGDNLAMTVSQIIVHVSGTTSDTVRDQVTWRLNGTNVTNVTGTYNSVSDTITFSSLSISIANNTSETYTINAYYNDTSNLTDKQTFIFSVDGDTDLTVGSSGTQMGATTAVNNGTGSTVDVTATALVFTTQPASSTSGSTLGTQPVVAAQDAFGNIDVDFTETITLTESSAGTLSGDVDIAAVSGVATFTDIAYAATADQQSFTLTADDESGVGTNLSPVEANSVTSDVVATKLLFTTEPAPTSVESGNATAFTTVPVVKAVNANDVVDTGYSTSVVLSVTDPNDSVVDGTVSSLTGTGDTDGSGTTVTLTPSSGVATFSNLTLTYTNNAVSDSLALRATSGGLTAVNSTTLTSAIVPTVTAGNISISGANGTGGAFKTGDTVIATWNNTAGGDNNSGITGVTMNFSAFGGGTAVVASNNSGSWTATYTITSGVIDSTNLNVSVTAANSAGSKTTSDDTNATVDSQAPTLTDGHLSISGASGTSGAFKVGDTVTVTWDDTAGTGDNNSDTISGVTVDFSAFGGGSSVAASNSSDTWTATYTIVAGAVDGTNLNISATATDDAGNTTTTSDTTNATVDNVVPTLTDANINVTSSGSGTGGTYVTGNTITVEWDNTGTGDANTDTISAVTVDFSAFGGGSAVSASNSSDTWTASYTLTSGSLEASNLNVSVTTTDNAGNTKTTADTSNLTVDNSAPTVTDAKISISGASGTGGAYKIGDTVTATWDNTASGDNNGDVSAVSVNFSAFGGGSAVVASNSSGTWTATYLITSGVVDSTNVNVSVRATDSSGNNTVTSDSTNATVDNVAPTVTSGNLSLSGASGTGGAFKIGDTVTAVWDNTSGGDNNSDTISGVTMDFSAFGGGSNVSASNSSGTWTATYTFVAGAIDGTNFNVSATATDNAGNTTTTTDDTNATADNVAPTVTDGNISVTSTGSGTSGEYITGDTITVVWNNTSGGDNNTDTISSVTVDFSAFGGGSAVSASDSSGTWTASYVVTSGAIDTTNLNVSVTATDNAGNTKTTADTTNLALDNTAPTVTDANISISGASGTGGAYKIGDTVTATWDNTASGDNNSDTISGVTVDFSAFGGGSSVSASDSSGTWTASYTIISGVIDSSNLNVSVTATDNANNSTTTADGTNATVDNSAPTVTDTHLSLSGASGTGGAFKIGDTVTAVWDNTASGDNNSDTISGLTVNFSAFGGGSSVAASNSSGTWTATYLMVAGAVDGTNLNVSATATDNAGNTTTTADGTNATVDNIAPTVTDGNINVTSTGSGTGGAYIPGDTITVAWDNSSGGDNNTDTISGVTVDFSAFGGGSSVSATNSSGTWSASYIVTSGAIDSANLNASVTATDNAGNTTTTADTSNLTIDNVAPTVTDANISISGASGTSGAYKIGDTVTATWDNTSSGDNNSDTISTVTVDFSDFGGGTSVSASDSSGTWTATYTITSGSIDTTNLNVSVTATDNANNSTTTADGTNATVDNIAPTVTNTQLSIGGASGTSGAFKIGDTVTAVWDNTASGDNNSDTISDVTVNFSAFGGGTAVTASNSSGTWSASYTIVAGAVDGTLLNISATATDNAGNTTTTADDTDATVDNIAPTVTNANINVTSTGSGTGGAYITGDTVTIAWDNTASGDNNTDTISGVTVNFSAFGGGSSVSATNSSGTWSASYIVTTGAIDSTNLNASVTATDNAGNTNTAADTSNLTIDNVAPTVTDANISISGDSGTDGAYKIGDTVTATWDNTSSGDNNSDTISTVTVDFSDFGGGTSVSASDSSGTWTATYTITSGAIDTTNLNVSVTATDNANNSTTTTDGTNATVDNIAPTVTNTQLSIGGASGTSGAFKIGDTVTAVWDNTASGDNNTDTISGVTVNFSAFGGGTAVTASNSSGTWSASYTIVAGSVDGTLLNISATATDNAGNTTTTADDTNATVDNIAPTVTDANINVTSTGSGTGGAYIPGDTITVAWDNTSGGENNTDAISSVTVDFSAFGGGSSVSATNSSDTWSASYIVTTGAIDSTNLNASVTATDNAGNTTTTADTSNLTIDNAAPTVTDANISISGASGTSGAYKIGDTVTATWDNTSSGDNNSDTISTVTVDFSDFGGGTSVSASDSSGTWTATYTITSGSIDTTNLNVSVTATDNANNSTTTADGTNATVDNIAPTVTNTQLSIGGASGSGGAFKIGDTVTAVWDNTSSGDNNSDTISDVTVNFSAFGGGTAVTASNSSGTWSASYTIVAGAVDGTLLNISATATDNAGNTTTTADDTNATVDNIAPTVTDANISVTSTGSGTGGAYIPGDTITVAWDNTSGGENNTDTISAVTVDFSAFGGSATTTAANSNDTWTASYTVTSGAIDSVNLNASVTATDNAGNTTTTADTSNLTIDNVAPTITDANISISGDSGTGGAYKIGDTVTATWDNTSSGDNNGDISSVTVDFSDFGGGTSVFASNSSGTWTAIYTITSGSIDTTNLNVSVTAIDNANNSTTTADGTNATVDNITPTVTNSKLSIGGASGTSGAFKIGDTVTAVWDNTSSGDNNSDTISDVTVNFSAFGGGTAVTASNSSGTWSASYTIVAGTVDGTLLNISATATDNAGNTTTTADDTNATVDNIAPTVTDANISVTSTGSGTGGAYVAGDAITVAWDNTASGDNNTDTISAVTVDFSAFGGGSAVVASNSSGTWTASYTVTSGAIDSTNLNASVTATDNAGNTSTTADTSNLTIDNVAPTVTDTNISISGASGTSGAYKIGDTVTATWDNTSSGDNNGDIASVTVDFSDFGGGTSVSASNSSGTWTATYTIVSGSIDTTNLNVSVTATDNASNSTTTADSTNATVDNIAPTVTNSKLAIGGASGTSGAFKIGDTVTAVWDNTSSGDNNSDTISGVTVNFSAFGGGTAVVASNSSGTWSASYTIVAGTVDGTLLNILATATDNAGNTTTTADDTNATVDNIAPTVTDANISVTSTGSGTSGAYVAGDTITVAWDNTASGDNNTDTIAGVTMNFSAFGGGTAVVASNSSGIWSASYVVTTGSLDSNSLNASVTATDNAGNTSTTADTSGLTLDNVAPTVTDASISITGASGTSGAYIIGDTVTATWDNTASGDNNSDIASVTVDFSDFGGSSSVSASNSSGTWTATYTIVSGSIDTTNLNVSVTATDNASNNTTTADSTNATVDNIAPTVTNSQLAIGGASGSGGAFKIGDTVTAVWDNTSSGDNNSDTISGVTMNFSAFGGGTAVVASNSSGTWSASYTIVASTVDGTLLNVSATATDNAGNTTTTADDTNASVDTVSPTVTDANSAISGASGTSGAYKIGDTVTATWDNTASGDNNSDISSVTVDFSAFGGGATVSASNSSGLWTATYTLVSGTIDSTNINVAVTATDDAGNATSTSDSTNATVDNQALTVTTGHVALSGASGTGGAFIVGDTVTATWDNTASGDNNGDTVAAVTVNFSSFGGTAVSASNSSGLWSATYTLTSGSSSGSNLNVSVSATDNAGNVTTQTDDTNATVDVGVPTVTNVTSSTADGAYKAGDSISLQVAFSDSVTVTGTPQLTLETGSTDRAVDYSTGSGGTTLTFVYTVQSGDTSSDLDYLGTSALALNGGTIKDANGNPATLTLVASGATQSLGANKALVIDTTLPTVAEVTAVSTPAADNTPDVTFSTSETGTLSVGGSCGTSSSTTLSSTGNHTITLTQSDNSTALADGTYTDCTVTVTDAAGNANSALSLTAFTVDTTAPSVSSTPDLAAASDSGRSNTDDITNVTTPTFTGTAEANATVTLSSDQSGVLGSTSADGSGAWSLTVGSAMTAAVHSITATVKDAADNTSAASSALSVTIDTSAPTTPAAPDLVASSDTGSSSTDDVTNDSTPEISGSSEVDVIVALSSDHDGALGSATADGSGIWSLTPTAALTDDTHSLTYTATDVAGNTSAASAALSITVDTAAPTVSSVSPSDDATAVQYDDNLVVTFSETVLAGTSGSNSISVYQADATLHETYAANDSNVSVSGATVTIDPTTEFTPTKSYYVTVGALAFVDTAGNAFAGISSNSTWNFALANNLPQVSNDTANTNEDAAVAINVLANDTDEDSTLNPASVTVTSGPSHGSTSVNTGTGVVTYTPTADYNGSDSFTYTVEDLQGGASSTATVNITAAAVNDNPVASNDLATTAEDTAVTIDVAANDSDIDSGDSVDTATLAVITSPSHGTAQVSSGKIVYTPSSNFNGSDSLTYTINDSSSGATSDVATVIVNVTSVNDLPTAANDSASTDEDTAVAISVLDNDSDLDGTLDASTVMVLSDASHGSTAVNATTGVITYTPSANYNGADSFTYVVQDNSGGTSSPVGTVSITVNAVNDAPVAVADTAVLLEDTAHTINAKGNDSDVDNDNADLTLVVVTAPAQGAVVISSGAFVYTPDVNFNGSDSFTYKLMDTSLAESNVVAVTLTVQSVNDEPIANNDSVQTDEDTALVISPLSNDSDADGTLVASTLSVLTSPTHGQLTDQGDGTVTYTPDADYNGADSFTYTIQDDESGTSNTATVSITVNAVNDDPVAVNDTATVDEDSSVVISPLSNDSDVDGTLTTLVIDSLPTNGSTLVNTDNTVTYTPNTNFDGSDSFTYHVVDDLSGTSSSATVSITVNHVNVAPTISGTPATTVLEDNAYSFIPTLGDQDVDTLTVSATNLPSWLSLNGTTGALTGTPTNNDVGVHSNIILTVNDGETTTDLAAFSITVINTNDAPVASNDSYSVSEGGTLTATALDGVLANDTDVDGDSVQATLITSPSRSRGFSFNADGTFSYQHNGGESVTDSFTYRISDGVAESAVATVTIAITPVNDPPVFSSTPTQNVVVQGETYRYAMGVTDTDSQAQVTVRSGPSWLTLKNGVLSGTAPLDSTGTESVTLVASDEEFEITQTFSFEVVAREEAKVQITPVWEGTPAVVGDDIALKVTVSHLSGPALPNATLRVSVTGDTQASLSTCTAVLSQAWECALDMAVGGSASWRMTLTPQAKGDVVVTLKVLDQDGKQITAKVTDASIGESVVSQGNQQFNLTAATAIASLQLLPDDARELVAGTTLGSAVKLLDYDLDTGVATEIGEIDNTGETKAITVADLNKDGLSDLVVVNSEGALSGIYYNQGNLVFMADANNTNFAHGNRAIVQDLNDDTYPEVIIGGNSINIYVYENQGGVVNDRPYTLNAPSFIRHIATLQRKGVAAWNGRLVLSSDAAVYLLSFIIDELAESTGNSGGTPTASLRFGSGVFASVRAGVQIASTTELAIPNVSSLQVADLDGDGQEEVITGNTHSEDSGESTAVNIVAVSSTNQLEKVASFGGASSTNVDIGDFNGDGQQDLIVTNENNAHQIYLGTGQVSNFTAQSTVISKTSALSLTDDLNGDGLSDILIYDDGNETVDVFISRPDGELGVSTDLRASSELESLSESDFRFRYSIRVENGGDETVQDVVALITLPASLTFETLAEGCASTESPDEAIQVLRCDLATIAAGGSHQFDLVLRAPTGSSIETKSISAKLTSAAKETNVTDNESTGSLAGLFGGSNIVVAGGGSSGGSANVLLALLLSTFAGLRCVARRRPRTLGRVMGKIGVLLGLVTTTSVFNAPNAQAWEIQQDRFYVEGVLGRVSSNWNSLEFENRLDVITQQVDFQVIKTDRTSHSFVVGYEVDEHWSAEVGYLDWGKVELAFSVVTTNATAVRRLVVDEYPRSGDGFYAGGKFRFPLDERTLGFVKLGLWRWKGDYGITLGSERIDLNQSGTDAVVGAGVSYPLCGNLRMTFQVQAADLDGNVERLLGFGGEFGF